MARGENCLVEGACKAMRLGSSYPASEVLQRPVDLNGANALNDSKRIDV